MFATMELCIENRNMHSSRDNYACKKGEVLCPPPILFFRPFGKAIFFKFF